MAERKSPSSKSETLKVIPLTAPLEQPAKPGRKPKRKIPPLPQEIMDGMTDIEQQHFEFFVESVLAENPDLRGTDFIFVNLAGLDYINTLRLEVQQLSSGELVTMSRQHPGVQFRAWIDMLSVSRKARQGGKSQESEEKANTRAMLLGLSS
jgi:hypothetical protein